MLRKYATIFSEFFVSTINVKSLKILSKSMQLLTKSVIDLKSL